MQSCMLFHVLEAIAVSHVTLYNKYLWRIRLIQSVACGSDNPKVLTRIIDTWSNRATTQWFCILPAQLSFVVWTWRKQVKRVYNNHVQRWFYEFVLAGFIHFHSHSIMPILIFAPKYDKPLSKQKAIYSIIGTMFPTNVSENVSLVWHYRHLNYSLYSLIWSSLVIFHLRLALLFLRLFSVPWLPGDFFVLTGSTFLVCYVLP